VRLGQTNDQKWSRLLQAWNRRDQGDLINILALSIGRDLNTAAALVTDKLLERPQSFVDAANDNNVLRIAARMAGPLPLSQTKSILEKVRSCRARNTPKLEEISEGAWRFLHEHNLQDVRPHVQGNELAIWLRRTLDLSANRRVDPIYVLERKLNVDVRVLDFAIPTLEAIAVWGPQYGPAVLLNKTSSRLGNFSRISNIWKNGVLRVTAAHELCHLIIDSNHPLSAVDVLGGRMPLRVEQRARAFAAEFLLPSEEAGEVWRSAGYPLDLETLQGVIRTLCRKHNVTESVAAWQLQHGAPQSNWEDLDRVLNQLVPHR
jgi:IrrE N-terminal-like domain